jgi:hypothetical protein
MQNKMASIFFAGLEGMQNKKSMSKTTNPLRKQPTTLSAEVRHFFGVPF